MRLDGKSLLLIRLSSLGDLILVLPTFWALRKAHPGARISWLVRKDLVPVIEGTPGLDEIIPVDLISITDKYASMKEVIRGVSLWLKAVCWVRRHYGGRPFDVVLDLQGLFKSAFFAFLLGKERYGFGNGKEWSSLFLNRAIFRRDRSRHAVDNYLQFARYLGAKPAKPEFPLFIPDEARERMRRFLSENGFDPRDFIVFLAPTARWETKFWSQEGFARVADALCERYGAKVILSGLPEERGYLEGIRERMHHRALVSAGKTGIKDFFALLEVCDLYVGVDSGSMHVARALGIPTVAVFGPSNPSWIGPYGQKRGVVRVDISCSPCNRKRCSDKSCMKGITPEMVLEEVEEVLAEKGRPGWL